MSRAIFLCLIVALGLPGVAQAGEGGTWHVLPGANATLVDLPPTAPGSFLKPMLMNYRGSATARIPTAAGPTANLEAEATTFVLGGGHTFEAQVLGGAHYSVAAFLPYSRLEVSGDMQRTSGSVAVRNRVDGFGDLTLVPLMLAWKDGDWQLSALAPIYAPTGSYQVGRLGNPGLNYWTFDLIGSVSYASKASGLNASLQAGFAMNTRNRDTDYRSGNLLHFDGSLQQLLPLGPGAMTLGLEGFYFQQVSCDSGSGATLGCFKGRTAGLGPVLGYLLPLQGQALSVELKWLAELETKNRLDGDYVWLKLVWKF